MTCGLRPCMHTAHARGLWYDMRTHSSEEGPRTEAQSSTARSSTAQRRGSAELRHEEGHRDESVPNRCRSKKTNIIQSHYQ